MRPSEQRTDSGETLAILQIAIATIHSLATMHEVMWRKPGTVGKRYFGTNAFFGWMIAVPLGVFLCPPGRQEMLLIIAWWGQLGLLLLHRLASIRTQDRVYSLYIGDSLLTGVFWMDEAFAKTWG